MSSTAGPPTILPFVAFVAAMTLVAMLVTATRVRRHRVLVFMVVWWILASHVFDGIITTLDSPLMVVDIRMDRILLFVLLGFAFVQATLRDQVGFRRSALPRWLRLGIVYMSMLALVNVLHTTRDLPLRDALINLSLEGTFFVVVFVVAVAVSEEASRVIVGSLIAVCLISAVISVIQFFVAPDFFRYGIARPAFAGIPRANGVFATDHVQAYWLIAGISVTALTIRARWLRIGIIGLLVVGLVLTFHRMSWIVFVVLVAIYAARVLRAGLPTWLGLALLAALTIGSVRVSGALDDVERSALVQERLAQDTGGYRLLFTALVLSNLGRHPLAGVGGVSSPEYYGMVRAEGLSEEEARGEYGGIHNTYLQIAFFKGLPVAIAFTAFLLAGVLHFGRADARERPFAYIGFSELVKYSLACLTNGILLGSEIGILMAILLGVSIGVDRIRGEAPVPS